MTTLLKCERCGRECDDLAKCICRRKPDYRALREHIRSGGIFHDFPMEGVTCGVCKTEGCLMYPDPGEDESAPAVHRPSTVCPRCSSRPAETFLRARAEEQGFTLKPIGIFTTASA